MMTSMSPSSDGPWDWRLGEILSGKWRLDAVLGRGGMATVYAATHRNRSRVAIKVLHSCRESDLVERFTKEGYLGNLVDHRGVVRTLDDGVTRDGAPFLVMELLEGETLEQRITRAGSFGVAQAVAILCEVLEVLAAAHRAGVVHRDVKPENVFLLRGGGVKILDFGIARERVFTRPNDPRQTVVGVVMGSPGYMSPEQALGLTDEIDARTDVWSVAATLFAALTARELRPGRTPEEKLCAAICCLPPVQTIAPEIPPALAAVLDRALAFDKGNRFPSAEAFCVALRACQAVDTALRDPSFVRPPVASRAAPARHGATSLPWIALAASSALFVVMSLLTLARHASGAPASFLPPVPTAPQVVTAQDEARSPVVVLGAGASTTPLAAMPETSPTTRPLPAPQKARPRSTSSFDPLSVGRF